MHRTDSEDLKANEAIGEVTEGSSGMTGDVRGGNEIIGIDHVEMYVNDAQSSATWFREKFGFQIWQDRDQGDEAKGQKSFVAVSGRAKVRFTSDLGAGAIEEFVQRHGEFVRDVSMSVSNVDMAYRRAIEGGATGVTPPHWTLAGQRTATVGDARGRLTFPGAGMCWQVRPKSLRGSLLWWPCASGYGRFFRD